MSNSEKNSQHCERMAEVLDALHSRALDCGKKIELTSDELLAITSGMFALKSEARMWNQIAAIVNK